MLPSVKSHRMVLTSESVLLGLPRPHTSAVIRDAFSLGSTTPASRVCGQLARYVRPSVENSTAISVGRPKLDPYFLWMVCYGQANLGRRLAAAGDVVFSGAVSSNMLGRLIPDSGPNNHSHGGYGFRFH
jgi:hypothetical protein